MVTASASTPRRRIPRTLVLGVVILMGAEVMLFVDVQRRGGFVVGHTPGTLPAYEGAVGYAARYVAQNMTPLCWIAYLLAFDGLLTALSRKRQRPEISSIRARPNRFLIIWLTSIPVWCYFDYVNFYFMDAWRYHGLPAEAASRYTGYFIAFAAISPGMFLAAEWFQRLGMARLRTTGVRINRPIEVACVLLGVLFVAYPYLIGDPIGNLTLWISLMFLLDPINHWLAAPSIIGDWKAGRWGRTLSLMAGGALCGFCWEFWNYWATAKWTYHLPFIGNLHNYRYFEMPWIGFMGFLPFAVECWVVANTGIRLLELAGLRIAEPLPDEDDVM